MYVPGLYKCLVRKVLFAHKIRPMSVLLCQNEIVSKELTLAMRYGVIVVPFSL